ncbi:hypothetical protein CVIRNUC_003571 [Coccomyxa viridis]|uniref:C2H2-type domain-containing protein n=1 Tax=Coccomyxa viridis TaxID=1274662 RepID=A0AAV1I0I3_9CHLO|nr:hypothetical protein CVIRNUC_003571 [Coccomyxa viridis]
MPPWICQTCGLELSSKHTLQCHINRKFKCFPPGHVPVEVHECETCDKQFKRRNLLEQHFGTEKHKRAVAAAEAAAGTSSSVVTSESHNTNTSHVTNSHNTTNITNNYNVQARPRSFGKADVDHLVSLTCKQLMEKLDIREKCGLTPFLEIFKLLHLNPDFPKNHNVLIDTSGPLPIAFAFKQRHWREVDSDGMVRDCVNNAAIRLLDIESTLAPKLSTKCFDRLTKARDLVERETTTVTKTIKEPSADVQALLRRTSKAIASFTEAHPELLAHAKADAEIAPELVRAPKTRDLPEWEPGVGHRWLALAKMQQTGEYPIPPSE